MLNIGEIRGVGYKLRRNHTFVFFWPGSGVIKLEYPYKHVFIVRFSSHALRHIDIDEHSQLVQVYRNAYRKTAHPLSY